MFSEIDFQTSAQIRQDKLLAEAETRRLLRSVERRPEPAVATSGRRLPSIVRRLVGAPTFA